MASDYNSLLISKLYNSSNEDEIIETLEEIAEIKDEVFVMPVFDTYKRVKDVYPHIAHYFVNALGGIRSESVRNILLELLEGIPLSRTKGYLLSWILSAMAKQMYYPEKAIEIAGQFVRYYDNDLYIEQLGGRGDYELETVLGYLKDANQLNKDYISILKRLLFASELSKREREVILYFLVRIDPETVLQDFLSGYKDIKNTNLELIVTKELISWKGKKVDELKSLILKEGQNRAKEMLEKFAAEKRIIEEKNRKQVVEEETKEYSNFRLVEEIVDLRGSINANTKNTWKIIPFPNNELLLKQAKVASSEGEFVRLCNDLRAIVGQVSSDLGGHGLSKNEVEMLLPDSTDVDRGKPLNQFYLYLSSRGLKIDADFLGLKPLMKVLSLIDHPEAKHDLLEKLEELKIKNIYEKQEWAVLHHSLLTLYKQSLSELHAHLVPQ